MADLAAELEEELALTVPRGQANPDLRTDFGVGEFTSPSLPDRAAEAESLAELENVFAETLDAGDAREYFSNVLSAVRQVAGAAVRPGSPTAALLRQFTAHLQRYRSQGYSEMEALEDLAEQFAGEGQAEAAPLLGGMAARALARPLMRRTARPLPPPLRRQLVRSGRQAAQTLARRQGLAGLRAIPPIVRRTQRTAAARRLPPRALPTAMRNLTARVARTPALARQLSRPQSPRSASLPTATPRVLTYSTNDVIDPRISVPAQHALVRLSKNPTTSADAVGMLEEVKGGGLGGIYCVNWQKAAQRALRLGTNWWTVIPSGEDAVLMMDPNDLWGGQPLIAFRRTLDPDCGLLKGEQRFAASPSKLDVALLRVWQTYLRFRQGGIDCFSIQSVQRYRASAINQRSPKVIPNNLVCGPNSWYRLLNEPIPLKEHEIVIIKGEKVERRDVVLESFKESVYGKESLAVNEVLQGEIRDCPLPAILAAMVHTRRFNRKMIVEKIPACVLSLRWRRNRNPHKQEQFDEHRTNRYFSVSFRTRPELPVDISDLFYRRDQGTTPIYARSRRNRLWISIIEKAYAVFRGGENGYGGNYTGIERVISSLTKKVSGPTVNQFMEDICGLGYIIDIEKRQVLKRDKKGEFDELKVNFDTALIQVLSNARATPTIACTENHSQAVLGLRANRNVWLYDAAHDPNNHDRHGFELSKSYDNFKREYKYVFSASR
ncbi:MAG: hypothetical protein BroJett011_75470 [Chloroflexota bacterium]|nr:MAG: hypothetical protein BroJett011_75470 [Chloroflexota bacterium]